MTHTKVFDKIPQGWKIMQGAVTAPHGLMWINNGKSHFAPDYEQALCKQPNF